MKKLLLDTASATVSATGDAMTKGHFMSDSVAYLTGAIEPDQTMAA